MTPVKAFGRSVLIKPIDDMEVTKGGLFIASQHGEDHVGKGELVSVGHSAAEEFGSDVSLGDIVFFPKYSGESFSVEGESFRLMPYHCISGVLQSREDVKHDK